MPSGRRDDPVPSGEAPMGEAGIIAGYMAPLAAGFPGALGLCDDCAFLGPPAGEEIVLKTDAVAEGIHFLTENDPADIGWKALAVNVSDLAAKGARPLVYLMALSFPQMPRPEWLARFTSGLAAAQARFGIHLAGGDTDKRPGPITITITVIGAVPAGRRVVRTAGQAGDKILVSGTLGDSSLGLALAMQPQLARTWALTQAEADHLSERYLRPEPRLGLRRALLDHARAAMDLSDGLAKDLGRLCLASGVAGDINVDCLPLSSAARKAVGSNPELIASVIASGDDYEVLATVAPADVPAYIAASKLCNITTTEIGCLTPGIGVRFLTADGSALKLAATGWDHFG